MTADDENKYDVLFARRLVVALEETNRNEREIQNT